MVHRHAGHDLLENMMAERLERSVLLVPGSNWDMIQKTAASKADAVCIDLEDAVAPEEKEASRTKVIRAFQELDFGDKLKMFRMNGLDTHFAYRDIIEIVEAAGDRIDLIVIPKVNCPRISTLWKPCSGRSRVTKNTRVRLALEALIETALGCVNIREIAACSTRLEGLVYGPGDFAASVRMPMESIGRWTSTMPFIPAIAGITSCSRS
jgi:citrate lyase beta subunit